MDRAIVHMDLDTFFVSCERLMDSSLIGKPVLIGGTSDRGVVASCSYEARKFGVHSAMPMRMAKQLCPEAIVIRGSSGIYSKYSRLVTDIIRETVPLYEKTSIDEFYLDLSGMDRFFGTQKIASELRARIIRESGLPISFGLSLNKTVSKIATGEAKPNNEIQVGYGTEKQFLAPLSVKKIPMIGNKTYRQLCDLGIKEIGALQQMPIELMESVFGKNGIAIWRKANGIDNTPVIPYQERKSISTERTFDQDTTNTVQLEGIITTMVEHLCFQLRKKDKLTSCVTIKIRYSDFQTYTLQKHIPYGATDHIILPIVKELFRKLYNRRVLVRLIGVKFSHLVQGAHQINLFEDTSLLYLYKAMDNMRERYGERAIMRASGMEGKTIERWNPFNGDTSD